MSKLVVICVLFITSFMSIAEPLLDKQPEDSILLTVFLKHDQSNSFEEYQKILEEQGFFENFPPKGGICRELVCDDGDWAGSYIGGTCAQTPRGQPCSREKRLESFTVEFYPTYNLYPVFKDKLKNKTKVTYQ